MTDTTNKNITSNDPPDPHKLNLIPTAFASEGDWDPVLNETKDNSVSWKKGFTDAYEIKVGAVGGKSIERKKDNYLKYVFSKLLQTWQFEAFPMGYPGNVYLKNSIIRQTSIDNIYLALNENTLNKDSFPGKDWQKLILQRAVKADEYINKSDELLMTPLGVDSLIETRLFRYVEYLQGLQTTWDKDQLYYINSIVSTSKGISNQYISLQSPNKGNSLNNSDYWQPLVLKTAIKPEDAESNVKDFLMTPWATDIKIRAIAGNYFRGLGTKWSTNVTYYKNSIVTTSGEGYKQYVSLMDGNKGKDVIDPTSWQELAVIKATKVEAEGGASDDCLMTPLRTKEAIAKLTPKPEGVPIGSMFCFASVTIPENYLLCDGTKKRILEYPALFDVIKDTFGEHNELYFSLPDMQGYTARGWDKTGKVDTQTGREFGSKQQDSFKTHIHDITDRTHNHAAESAPHSHKVTIYDQGGDTFEVPIEKVNTTIKKINVETSSEKITIDVEPVKTGITKTEKTGESETRMKNVALSWIIKAK